MTKIDQTSEAFLLYRDATKDAYGFRMNPTATTQEELEADYDRVCEDIVRSIEAEAYAKSAAWIDFNKALDNVAATIGGDRSKALRYLIDAEDDIMASNDLGYFCYLNGLEYTKVNTLKEMLG